MKAPPRILFVGLGSPHGDDQIGWRIAEELRPLVAGWNDVAVRKAAIPLDLIDWLEGIEQLHLCDACRSDEPSGTLFRLEAARSQNRKMQDKEISYLLELKHLRSGGSHNFGLAAVLDLAGRLGRLPETTVVHAVAGRRFAPGATMSEGLPAQNSHITRTILKELAEARDVARAVAAEPG